MAEDNIPQQAKKGDVTLFFGIFEKFKNFGRRRRKTKQCL